MKTSLTLRCSAILELTQDRHLQYKSPFYYKGLQNFDTLFVLFVQNRNVGSKKFFISVSAMALLLAHGKVALVKEEKTDPLSATARFNSFIRAIYLKKPESEVTSQATALLIGNPDFKDSLENYTLVANQSTTDYFGGQLPVVAPFMKVEEGKRAKKTYVDFGSSKSLDVMSLNMCTRSAERLDPKVAAIFNNSDKEGRITWYGVLQTCLAPYESRDNWKKGTPSWRMVDSTAHGANKTKVVTGLFCSLRQLP